MKLRYSLALLVLCLPALAQAQQIPNGSFESWETNGNPTGWITTNFAGLATPITQSNTAADGQSSLRGEVLGLGPVSVPAMAATGKMLTAETFELGFPFTSRPAAFNGFASADLSGSDTLNIIAVFRSGGDSIGVAFHRLGTDQANLTSFSAPVYWLDSRTPDTAYVMILVDGEPAPTAGSTFNVDGLSFGATAGVESSQPGTTLSAMRITGGYELAIANADAERSTLEIIDIHGRVIETLFDGAADQIRVRWMPKASANGLYLARLTTPRGIATEKLILAR